MSVPRMKQEMEKRLGFKFEYDEILTVEVYDNIFKPLIARNDALKIEVNDLNKSILEKHNNEVPFQSKIKQFQSEINQLNEELKQVKTNYETLEQSHTQTLTSLNRLQGSVIKMPKYISLMQKHIDEYIDGITVTELSRVTKKSRASVYRAVKWLVSNDHIVKQGPRYLSNMSVYRITNLDRSAKPNY